MGLFNQIIRSGWALFTVLLMSCGATEPPLPPIDPGADSGVQAQAPRPNKEGLGDAAYCDTWREDIADEISSTPRWGLPATGVVSENINGFFAAQRLIDGIDYYPCVLADIFAEIPLHVEVLREAYFALAPQVYGTRAELAQFLHYLYEEPLTIPLLLDIAIKPVPEGIDEEEESVVRVTAVMAISGTAPREGDRQIWIDALFEVVARGEVGGVPLVATWELKNMGIDRAEFEERMGARLSEEDFSYLLENGWQ